MQYINAPGYSGIPMDNYGRQPFNPNPYQNQPMMQQPPMPQQPKVDPRMFETPTITINNSKPMFTVTDNKNSAQVLHEDIIEEPKKRRGRPPKKEESFEVAPATSGIIKSGQKEESTTGTVEDVPTSYTYFETTGLLRETLGQIDAINGELVQEFNNVRHNRTMKNKYNVLVGLSENIGSLINNRISVIREINNSISKSNDLDYKKYKDMKAANSVMNDDKYIADLYKSFISNPNNAVVSPQVPAIDAAVFGSNIIRANITPDQVNGISPIDLGYLNYQANITPEQNMMRYENDPNVKQVVVYDASTGNKFFQVMNLATKEVIPNVPVYDQMFMEDTTLDLANGIAKNINLNETFPIITINDNITSQY